MAIKRANFCQAGDERCRAALTCRLPISAPRIITAMEGTHRSLLATMKNYQKNDGANGRVAIMRPSSARTRVGTLPLLLVRNMPRLHDKAVPIAS